MTVFVDKRRCTCKPCVTSNNDRIGSVLGYWNFERHCLTLANYKHRLLYVSTSLTEYRAIMITLHINYGNNVAYHLRLVNCKYQLRRILVTSTDDYETTTIIGSSECCATNCYNKTDIQNHRLTVNTSILQQVLINQEKSRYLQT